MSCILLSIVLLLSIVKQTSGMCTLRECALTLPRDHEMRQSNIAETLSSANNSCAKVAMQHIYM